MTDALSAGVDALGYYIGQCTDGVARLLSWIPSGLGNAYQWLGNAQAKGYQTTNNLNDVVPGSVVVFSSNYPGSGGYGHVAVVNSVNAGAGTISITEMNGTAGVGVYDSRTVSGTSYVEGYILPPTNAQTTAANTVASTTNPSNQTTSSSSGGTLSNIPGVGTALSAIGTALQPETRVLFFILIGIGVFVLAMLLFAGGGIALVKSSGTESQ